MINVQIVPSPATDSPSAAAWAFVLAHSRVILSAARRSWKDDRVDHDDFHHDLVVDVARNFHKFDQSRASAVTWIYLRARKTKDRTLRSLSARKDRAHGTRSLDVVESETESPVILGSEAGEYGSHETMLAQVTVREVLRFASPLQADACQSAMEGWTGEEVRQSFGCSMSARNDRLHRLGRRVKKSDAP
jgi:DNA-directed RNA polymerase specialized sigma24 family protein